MTIYNLAGLRVLNTRPGEAGLRLSQAIEQAHGTAIACQALAIQALPITFWLDNLPPVSTINKAIFISTNAVNYFFAGIKQHGVNWPISIENLAIGKASAQALLAQQIKVHSVPECADSEHLLTLPVLQCITQQTILLVKGEDGRSLISQTLLHRGANLVSIEVYKRTRPSFDNLFIKSLWQNDAVDIILFTSQQAMLNVISMFGSAAKNWLCQKPCLVYSERLAQIARTFGISKVNICQPDSVIEALARFTQDLV